MKRSEPRKTTQRSGAAAALSLVMGFVLVPALSAQDTHWLIVSGLGGEAEYEELFHDWGGRLYSAVQESATSVHWLAEDPDADPARIDGRSAKDAVLASLDSLASASSEGDQVVIVLFGHGSFVEDASRLNLPGPDITDADFALALEGLAGRRVVFVNTASASGGFVPTLSASERVVLTATKTGGERNQTRFGEFFVQALEGEDSDQDKNGRISALEAFEFARRLTLGTYESDNKLATEHAVLDDNGDGRGSEDPGGEGDDGVLAGQWTLARVGGAAVAPSSDDPELSRLYEERAKLETGVADLRAIRDSLEPDEYQRRLESLLLELAELNRRIQARGGER